MKQKTKDIERLVNQMSTINHNMISFLGCACTWAIRRVLNSTSLASFDGEPRVVRKIKIRGFALLAFVSTAHQSFICWRKTIANARGVNTFVQIMSCWICCVPCLFLDTRSTVKDPWVAQPFGGLIPLCLLALPLECVRSHPSTHMCSMSQMHRLVNLWAAVRSRVVWWSAPQQKYKTNDGAVLIVLHYLRNWQTCRIHLMIPVLLHVGPCLSETRCTVLKVRKAERHRIKCKPTVQAIC